MTFDEYLDKLHRYREKRAEELSGLSPEERFEKANERGQRLAEEMGLTVSKPREPA